MRINSLVFITYQQHPQKLQFTKAEIKALNSQYAYLFKNRQGGGINWNCIAMILLDSKVISKKQIPYRI